MKRILIAAALALSPTWASAATFAKWPNMPTFTAQQWNCGDQDGRRFIMQFSTTLRFSFVGGPPFLDPIENEWSIHSPTPAMTTDDFGFTSLVMLPSTSTWNSVDGSSFWFVTDDDNTIVIMRDANDPRNAGRRNYKADCYFGKFLN